MHNQPIMINHWKNDGKEYNILGKSYPVQIQPKSNDYERITELDQVCRKETLQQYDWNWRSQPTKYTAATLKFSLSGVGKL